MTKTLALVAMLAAAGLVAGCDGGSPDSTAEGTAPAEQTDNTATGTTNTDTNATTETDSTGAAEEDPAKPAATD